MTTLLLERPEIMTQRILLTAKNIERQLPCSHARLEEIFLDPVKHDEKKHRAYTTRLNTLLQTRIRNKRIRKQIATITETKNNKEVTLEVIWYYDNLISKKDSSG